MIFQHMAVATNLLATLILFSVAVAWVCANCVFHLHVKTMPEYDAWSAKGGGCILYFGLQKAHTFFPQDFSFPLHYFNSFASICGIDLTPYRCIK